MRRSITKTLRWVAHVLLVGLSLSVTVVAMAAVHHRSAAHDAQVARRRAEGRAFVERLAGARDSTLALVAASPTPEPALLEQLVTVLRTEGRLFDDIRQVGAARERAAELVRSSPNSAHAALILGETELSLHRVDAARAAVATARRLGGDERDVHRLEIEVEWLAGDASAAAEGIRHAAEPSGHAELVRLGTLELEVGAFDAADAAFRRAEAKIDRFDVLGAATLALYRGLLAEARGRFDEAESHYLASIDLVPAFVPAADHLAELKAKRGDLVGAKALYERLVVVSPNPEFLGALAGVEERMGMLEEARAHRERARAVFEDLLRRFPEAMAWHAAEFFGSVGDTRRAVELLEANLAVRPNGTSRYALARALLEAGDVGSARPMIDAALAAPPRSAAMLWSAARIHAGAGDAAGACTYRARALALNPVVADGEPSLPLRCP